jgi:hypothetical protein
MQDLLKVGDIIHGTRDNHYGITHKHSTCIVLLRSKFDPTETNKDSHYDIRVILHDKDTLPLISEYLKRATDANIPMNDANWDEEILANRIWSDIIEESGLPGARNSFLIFPVQSFYFYKLHSNVLELPGSSNQSFLALLETE